MQIVMIKICIKNIISIQQIMNIYFWKYLSLVMVIISMNINVQYAIKIQLLVFISIVQPVKTLNYVFVSIIQVKNVILNVHQVILLVLIKDISKIINQRWFFSHKCKLIKSTNVLVVKGKFYNTVGCAKIAIISFSVKNASKTRSISKVYTLILINNIM